MPWLTTEHECKYPMYSTLRRPVGSTWQCPQCLKVYEVTDYDFVDSLMPWGRYKLTMELVTDDEGNPTHPYV